MKKVKLFRVDFATELRDAPAQKHIFKTWEEYKDTGAVINPPAPYVHVVAEDIPAAAKFVTDHFDDIASMFDQRDRYLYAIAAISEVYAEVLC